TAKPRDEAPGAWLSFFARSVARTLRTAIRAARIIRALRCGSKPEPHHRQFSSRGSHRARASSLLAPGTAGRTLSVGGSADQRQFRSDSLAWLKFRRSLGRVSKKLFSRP